MCPGKLQRPHPPLDSEEYSKSPGEAGAPETLKTQPGAPGSGRSRPLPPGEREGRGGEEIGAPGRHLGHSLEKRGRHRELIGNRRSETEGLREFMAKASTLGWKTLLKRLRQPSHAQICTGRTWAGAEEGVSHISLGFGGERRWTRRRRSQGEGRARPARESRPRSLTWQEPSCWDVR